MKLQPLQVLATAVIWCLSVGAVEAQAQVQGISGRAAVIEADLIEVSGQRIRLWGIDALEPDQLCYRSTGVWACGRAAISHLRDFIGSRDVRCVAQRTDADRTVHARCQTMGLDLSAELAAHGFALVRRDGPQDYILNHHDGRTHVAGLWGTIYVPPWEWRAGKRVVEWITDARGCAVKGDISEGGGRVYYLPNQPAFARVRIETDKGERWFCSADEAEAAGWVPHHGGISE